MTIESTQFKAANINAVSIDAVGINVVCINVVCINALKRAFRWITFSLVLVGIVGCGSLTRTPEQLDDDQDSVINASDACPGTPRGEIIDGTGCSLFRGTITGVEFAPGDHRLQGSSRDALAALVEQLKQHPEVELSLAGHTDNRGSAAENLELSKQRVMAVVKYLVSNGIEAERLRPIGYGESRPMFSNATQEGRMKNRRIEMSVFSQ